MHATSGDRDADVERRERLLGGACAPTHSPAHGRIPFYARDACVNHPQIFPPIDLFNESRRRRHKGAPLFINTKRSTPHAPRTCPPSSVIVCRCVGGGWKVWLWRTDALGAKKIVWLSLAALIVWFLEAQIPHIYRLFLYFRFFHNIFNGWGGYSGKTLSDSCKVCISI